MTGDRHTRSEGGGLVGWVGERHTVERGRGINQAGLAGTGWPWLAKQRNGRKAHGASQPARRQERGRSNKKTGPGITAPIPITRRPPRARSSGWRGVRERVSRSTYDFLLPDWFVSHGEAQGSGLFPVHKIRILTLGGRKETHPPRGRSRAALPCRSSRFIILMRV